MTAADAVDIARDAIVVTLKLGLPVMLISMIVGLSISLVQALTQIQEMTLSFVPKMVIILVSMLVFLPFMLTTLSGFTQELAGRIVNGF